MKTGCITLTVHIPAQICKLRVWSEDGGGLFERLKDAARDLMAQIADHCDERFQTLATEPGGQELLGFHGDSSKLVGVKRQDHPEVLTICLVGMVICCYKTNRSIK